MAGPAAEDRAAAQPAAQSQPSLVPPRQPAARPLAAAAESSVQSVFAAQQASVLSVEGPVMPAEAGTQTQAVRSSKVAALTDEETPVAAAEEPLDVQHAPNPSLLPSRSDVLPPAWFGATLCKLTTMTESID